MSSGVPSRDEFAHGEALLGGCTLNGHHRGGLWSDDCMLVRLPAYFAEFARKAKIVRRTLGPSSLEREQVP